MSRSRAGVEISKGRFAVIGTIRGVMRAERIRAGALDSLVCDDAHAQGHQEPSIAGRLGEPPGDLHVTSGTSLQAHHFRLATALSSACSMRTVTRRSNA